jgi:hypothetical protein
VSFLLILTPIPRLKPQEIPRNHPDSCNMFQPGPDNPFLATPAAIQSKRFRKHTLLATARLSRNASALDRASHAGLLSGVLQNG